MGLRIFTPLGELLWYNLFSSLSVAHLEGMGFDFIMIEPLLPSLFGSFVFGCRVSFLVGSSIFFFFFWSMVVQQLVVIFVFL